MDKSKAMNSPSTSGEAADLTALELAASHLHNCDSSMFREFPKRANVLRVLIVLNDWNGAIRVLNGLNVLNRWNRRSRGRAHSRVAIVTVLKLSN